MGAMSRTGAALLAIALAVTVVVSVEADLKINHADLLLPFKPTGTPISMQLHTTPAACCSWFSSNSTVADVLPEYAAATDKPASPLDGIVAAPVCAERAVVVASQRLPTRARAHLMVQVPRTDIELRCHVFVAPVHSIDLVTSTERFTVQEYHMVSLLGKDEVGNTFSTLEGLKFKWTVTPEKGVVQLLRLTDYRKVQVSSVRQRVEAEDANQAWCDAAIIHGSEPGTVRITAELMEPGYDVPLTVTRVITIVEGLRIQPSLTWLAPATELPYTVRRDPPQSSNITADARLELQMLPLTAERVQANFTWSLSTPQVGVMVPSVNTLVANATGSATVMLTDKRINDIAGSAEVHVLEPSLLDLVLTPVGAAPGFAQRATSEAPYLYALVDTVYTLQTEMVGFMLSSRRVLYLGANVPITMSQIPQASTGPILRQCPELGTCSEARALASVQQNHVLVSASREGITDVETVLSQISSKLTPITWTPVHGALRQRKSIMVTSRVSLVWPHPIVLPFEFNGDHQTVQLNATGGSGSYSWFTRDAISSVSISGGLTAGAQGVGNVTVFDSANPFNSRTEPVSVLPVRQLVFLPWYREVEVGQSVRIPITAKPEHGQYSACDVLSSRLEWTISNQRVRLSVESDPEPAALPSNLGPVCGYVTVTGVTPGTDQITVKYGSLSRSVRVSVYAPMEIVMPLPVPGSAPTAVASLHAQVPVLLSGGAKPWVTDVASRGLVPTVQIDDAHVASVTSVNNFNAFIVTCNALGETTATFATRNSVHAGVSDDLPVPAVSAVQLKIVCANPELARLRVIHVDHPDWQLQYDADDDASLVAAAAAVLPLPDPAEPDWSTVPTPTQTVVRLEAWDSSMPPRAFHNFSTAHFVFALSNPHLEMRAWPQLTAMSMLELLSQQRPELLRERLLQMQLVGHGAHIQTVYTTSSRGMLTITASSNPSAHGARTTAKLTLELVSCLTLSPPKLALYAAVGNSVRLTAAGGSGQFVYSKLQQDANEELLALSPDNSSVVATVTLEASALVSVKVTDKAIPYCNVAESLVDVTTGTRIVVLAPQLIELGSSATVIIDMYGSSDVLESLYNPYMNFTLSPIEQDVSFVTGPAGHTAAFLMTARTIGTFSLVVSLNGLSSEPVQITVFGRLRLMPEYVSMLPGARIVLDPQGGPSHCRRVFTSSDESVATVNSEGALVAVREGFATVRLDCPAVFMDGMRATSGIIATVNMTVQVAVPSSIVVVTSTNRLLVGSSIKLNIRSEVGQSPISFTGADIKYVWSVSEDTVLRLAPGSSPSATSETPVDFSAWVHGLSVGHATVRVSMTYNSALYGSHTWNDTHRLEVASRLQLLSPERLLLPLGGQARIRTTHNHRSLSYVVLSRNPSAPGITLDESTGTVFAGMAPTAAVVMVRDESKLQLLTITVEVKPVAQLALVPSRRVAAVGANMTVDVQLLDDLGQVFYTADDSLLWSPVPSPAGCAALDTTCSEDSMFVMRNGFGALAGFSTDRYTMNVAVNDNGTLIVAAKQEGSVVLRGWLPRTFTAAMSMGQIRQWEQEEVMRTGVAAPVEARAAWWLDYQGLVMADYVEVQVVGGVLPTAVTMPLGSLMRFGVNPKAGLSGGLWRSGDMSIVSIDAQSGIARALAPGRTGVYFDTVQGQVITSFASVTVMDILSIDARLLEGSQAVNWSPESPAVVGIWLMDESGAPAVGEIAWDGSLSVQCEVSSPAASAVPVLLSQQQQHESSKPSLVLSSLKRAGVDHGCVLRQTVPQNALASPLPQTVAAPLIAMASESMTTLTVTVAPIGRSARQVLKSTLRVPLSRPFVVTTSAIQAFRDGCLLMVSNRPVVQLDVWGQLGPKFAVEDDEADLIQVKIDQIGTPSQSRPTAQVTLAARGAFEGRAASFFNKTVSLFDRDTEQLLNICVTYDAGASQPIEVGASVTWWLTILVAITIPALVWWYRRRPTARAMAAAAAAMTAPPVLPPTDPTDDWLRSPLTGTRYRRA